jgi:hypothetical protein
MQHADYDERERHARGLALLYRLLHEYDERHDARRTQVKRTQQALQLVDGAAAPQQALQQDLATASQGLEYAELLFRPGSPRSRELLEQKPHPRRRGRPRGTARSFPEEMFFTNAANLEYQPRPDTAPIRFTTRELCELLRDRCGVKAPIHVLVKRYERLYATARRKARAEAKAAKRRAPELQRWFARLRGSDGNP